MSHEPQKPKQTVHNANKALVSASSSKRLVRSEQLLGGVGQLDIQHAGEVYCLRVTRQNKLILTK